VELARPDDQPAQFAKPRASAGCSSHRWLTYPEAHWQRSKIRSWDQAIRGSEIKRSDGNRLITGIALTILTKELHVIYT
jgi:hypothetical protein